MKFCEKLRLLRKSKGLTQAEFAESLGISRANLANIELGNIAPTNLFINCVSLMYHVKKDWLIDDSCSSTDTFIKGSDVTGELLHKFEMLNDKHKWFIEQQIALLLKIQQ